MTRRRLLALFFALAVAAGAWFWQRQPAAIPDAGSDEATATTGIAGTGSPAPKTRRQALPPMPPRDRDFARAFPDLKARADAGDRKAACRLASGLLRCLHGPELWTAANAADLERKYEAEGELAAANYYAQEQAWQLELTRECRDIPTELKHEGARYLRQSALAGDPSAMLAYGSGHHLNPNGRGIAVGPAFDTWRRESPIMLQRALLAGHPSAAFALSTAYMDDMGIPSAFVPDDAYQGAVHHILVARLFGTREYPGWLASLDAGELERARREATRLHQEVFGGKRYDRKHYFVFPPYMRSKPEAPAPCETPQ